jgi:fatty-acyl-CoA synthase
MIIRVVKTFIREIEEFLYSMPEIRGGTGSRFTSPKYGEEVGAFIILHEGKKSFRRRLKKIFAGDKNQVQDSKNIFFFLKEFQ